MRTVRAPERSPQSCLESRVSAVSCFESERDTTVTSPLRSDFQQRPGAAQESPDARLSKLKLEKLPDANLQF